MAELNDKQKAFCREFLKDFNGAQAAIRAGYSEKTARQIGSENLSKPDIQHHIQELANEMNEKTDNDIARIVAELQLVAFGSLKDVAEWRDGFLKWKGSDEISEARARMIAEIGVHEHKNGVNMRIKLHDKLKALELLGRYHKIFTDKMEHTGKDGAALLAGLIGDLDGPIGPKG